MTGIQCGAAGALMFPAAEGGISFVGSATATASDATTVAVDVSSLSAGTLSEDDLIICVVNGAEAANTDRGITAAGDNSGSLTELADLFSDDVAETNLGVYQVIQGATVDTTITFTFDATTDSLAAICMVYRGVNTTTPIDVATQTATGINGSIPDPPAITPTTAGAWVVVVGANSSNQGITTLSHSGLTDVVTDAENVGTRDACIGIGNYTSWTSGEYNPAVFTWSASSTAQYSWCAASIALRPA